MMKKNKLYTVNRWNQPAFMPKKENLFAGPFGSSQMNQPFQFPGFTPGVQAAIDKNIAASLPKAGGGIGGLLGGLGDKLGGVMGGGQLAGSPMGGLIGGLGSAVGGLANGLISNGLSSGAGSAVSSIGGTVGSMVSNVNPVLGGIISVGSGILGGGINALFGESVDEEALQAANAGTDAYNNFTSNAGSFEGITGPEVQANVKDVYRGGLFNDVSDKNEALKKERANARSWAFRSVDNNINNLVNDQMNDYLASYRAFGGKINRKNKYNMGGFKTSGLIGDLNTSMELPSLEEQYQMYGRGLLMPGESNVMGGKGPDTFTWANGGKLFGIGGFTYNPFELYGGHGSLDDFHQAQADNTIHPGVYANGGKLFDIGGDLQTHGADYSVGKIYDVSEKEANRLKAMGYEFTVVG